MSANSELKEARDAFKRSPEFQNISRFGTGQTLAGIGVGALGGLYAPNIFPIWAESSPLAVTIAAVLLIGFGLVYGAVGIARAEHAFNSTRATGAPQ